MRIGYGTDSGVLTRFEGFGEHMELQLMVEAGMTPAQVITAATKSSAEFLGQEKDLGTLEQGKWADLLVLGADPLANIRNSRQIDAVYIAGNKVHRVQIRFRSDSGERHHETLRYLSQSMLALRRLRYRRRRARRSSRCFRPRKIGSRR